MPRSYNGGQNLYPIIAFSQGKDFSNGTLLLLASIFGFAITLVPTRETQSRAGTNLRTKGLEILAHKLWPTVGAYFTRGSEPIHPALHYQMGRSSTVSPSSLSS